MNHSSIAYKLLGCFLCCCLLWQNNYAQTKPKPKATTPARSAADTLMPKLQTRFSAYRQGMPVFVADFKRILNAELVITDSTTGVKMMVKSFRFGWRRKEASDDIRTGKRKIISTFSAVDVSDKSQLPAAWQKELNEYLQPKEEVLFEAIIVQHPTTKKMFQAPSMVLKLQ